MQVVIEIPDRIHYGIEQGTVQNGSIASKIVLNAVKNGIVLPEGHGRLIDADRLLTIQMRSKYYHLNTGDTAIPIIDVEHAHTVVPADKGDGE